MKSENTDTGGDAVDIPGISISEAELTYASKDEIIKALEDAYKNIPNFHKRLIYFSLKYIRIYFNSSSFRGLAADDVVNIVIEKVINLKRKWYRNKIADLSQFLRFSILSFIRNEKKRKDANEPIDNSEEVYGTDGDLREEKFIDLVRETLRQDLIDKNFAVNFESLIDKCYTAFEKDYEAFFVFDARLDGETSNIKIAGDLKIEVKEVENALKRIKYKLNKIIKGIN